MSLSHQRSYKRKVSVYHFPTKYDVTSSICLADDPPPVSLRRRPRLMHHGSSPRQSSLTYRKSF